MAEKSFAEKYGLKGKPVRISEATKRFIEKMNRESAEVIQKGKEYVKDEKRGFGEGRA